MDRTFRIFLGVAALVLVVVATALAAPSERSRDRSAPVAASHQPQTGDDQEGSEDADEPDGQPSAQLLDRLVANLADAGITTDADALAALAADHGVGGAVRLLAWADAAGMSTDEIAAMFESGMGWGEIAHELNGADPSLDLHPGIGTIMGNGGGPPDHAKAHGHDTSAESEQESR